MLRIQSISLLILIGLISVLGLSACTDDRTRPTKPVEPSYTETYVLMDRMVSDGQVVSATVDVRDVMSAATLNIYCFVKADDDLNDFENYGESIENLESFIADTIDARLGVLEYLEQVDSLTVDDSLELADLRVMKTTSRDSIFTLSMLRDSLDVILDDRYQLAVKLDDGDWVYPNAVALGPSTLRNNSDIWADTLMLDFLADTTYIWGQGIYRTATDGDGWKGKWIQLDLTEFWIADLDYTQVSRPVRSVFLGFQPGDSGADPYTRYELFPVRSWLNDMSLAGGHTLSVKLAKPGVSAEVSATLYAVHQIQG